MRTFSLALLFACLVACVALAEDPPPQASQPETTTDRTNLFSPRLPVAKPQFRNFALPLAKLQFRTGPTPRVPVVTETNDCYTMRSYLMKREGKSDVTRQRGYTTCTPAARFRAKPAAPVTPNP